MKTQVANTSIETYHGLINSGTLTTRQAEVMAYMETVGGATRRQIAKALDWDTGSAAGRVNELVALGLLEEVGTAKCLITGKTVGLVCVPTGQSELF